MRPGWSEPRVPNCSATCSGAWLGSMIPPAPTRMLQVPPATCPISTAVAALAMPGMLWCSANQKRRYPRRSACCASDRELAKAWPALAPSTIGARSRTESGTRFGRLFMSKGDGVVHGEYKVPGGKLVVVDLSVEDGRIAQVQVSGDFFLEPDSALDSINAALRGLSADSGEAMIAAAVRMALAPGVELFGITPEGVAVAVRRALEPQP